MDQIYIQDWVRSGQTEADVHELYIYDDLPTTTPAEVAAHITLSTMGVSIQGRFRVTVEEPCDRCTEPYIRTLSAAFDERYVYENLTDANAPSERELHNDDFYDTIGPEGIVDLKDLIYQHIILALTTDRLCCEPDPDRLID